MYSHPILLRHDYNYKTKPALSGTSNIIFMKWGKHGNANDTNSLRLVLQSLNFCYIHFQTHVGCPAVQSKNQELGRWICSVLFWLDMGRL